MNQKGLRVTLPAQYNQLLDKLSRESGIDKGELILQAISLQKLFLDENRKGNKILIEDPRKKVFQLVEMSNGK